VISPSAAGADRCLSSVIGTAPDRDWWPDPLLCRSARTLSYTFGRCSAGCRRYWLSVVYRRYSPLHSTYLIASWTLCIHKTSHRTCHSPFNGCAENAAHKMTDRCLRHQKSECCNLKISYIKRIKQQSHKCGLTDIILMGKVKHVSCDLISYAVTTVEQIQSKTRL